MLKNKQPINLSFLVCLSIQSSNELTPWLFQTSRLHTIHGSPARHGSSFSTTACHLSLEKLQGLGVLMVSSKDAQAKPRVQRTGNSVALFGHKTAQPCDRTPMRAVRWCDWVSRQSHQSASFRAKLTATGLGKEGPISIAS